MKYGIIFFKDFIPKKKRQAREKTVPTCNMQKNISLDIYNLFLMIRFKSIIKNTS